MEGKILVPCVQYTCKANLGSEPLPVESVVEKGTGSRAEEHGEHEFLVVENERIELMGKSNNHVEVMGGKEPFEPLLDPLDLAQSLALGTVAVAAGVVGDVKVAASVLAHIHMPTESLGSTLLDGLHDLELIESE